MPYDNRRLASSYNHDCKCVYLDTEPTTNLYIYICQVTYVSQSVV